MSVIRTVEDYLLAQCREALDCYELADASVDTAPSEWSGAWVREYIRNVPAVRVIFDGGANGDEFELNLQSFWSIFVVTGWRGSDEAERRRAHAGAYRICEILARWLNHKLPSDAAGPIVPDTINNITEFAMERLSLTVYEIVLAIQLNIDSEPPPGKPLDDFLRGDIDWQLAGEDPPIATDSLEGRLDAEA